MGAWSEEQFHHHWKMATVPSEFEHFAKSVGHNCQNVATDDNKNLCNADKKELLSLLWHWKLGISMQCI